MHSVELIEEKLLNMTAENTEVIEMSLDQCKVDMFDKRTSPELSDLIWAVAPNILMKNDIPSNKGKLENAKYAIEHSSTPDKNRMFTSYMCRNKPNKLTPFLCQEMKFLQSMM